MLQTIKLVFTDKGEELINRAQHNGFKMRLTHVYTGTACYVPEKTATALQELKCELPIKDFAQNDDGSIHITAVDATEDFYYWHELGIIATTEDDEKVLVALHSDPNKDNYLAIKTPNTPLLINVDLKAARAEDFAITPPENAGFMLPNATENIPGIVRRYSGELLTDEMLTDNKYLDIVPNARAVAQADAQIRKDYKDDILKAMPIGSIIMWVGKTQPAGWLLCEGSRIWASKDDAYGTSEYDNLCYTIGLEWRYKNGTAYRTCVLPNLVNRYPKGVGENNAYLKTTGNKYNSISLSTSTRIASWYKFWQYNFLQTATLNKTTSFDVERTYVKFIIKYK